MTARRKVTLVSLILMIVGAIQVVGALFVSRDQAWLAGVIGLIPGLYVCGNVLRRPTDGGWPRIWSDRGSLYRKLALSAALVIAWVAGTEFLLNTFMTYDFYELVSFVTFGVVVWGLVNVWFPP